MRNRLLRPSPGLLAGALLAVVAAIATPGCFHYTPIDPGSALPDERIRVELADQAALRVTRDLGAFTPRLEGRLVPLGQDSLGVAVWVGSRYQGTPFQNAHQLVALARADMIQVERRTLSRSRTSLLAAGAVGAVVLLVLALDQEEDPNPPGNGGLPLPPDPPSGLRLAPWR